MRRSPELNARTDADDTVPAGPTRVQFSRFVLVIESKYSVDRAARVKVWTSCSPGTEITPETVDPSAGDDCAYVTGTTFTRYVRATVSLISPSTTSV